MTQYPLYRRLGETQGRSGWVRKMSSLLGFFCSLFVLYPYFFVLIILAFCLLSLLCNTRNTNIHAPDGIRSRNLSKRSAADPHLRPLGHWVRHGIWSPNRPARSELLYRPGHVGPLSYTLDTLLTQPWQHGDLISEVNIVPKRRALLVQWRALYPTKM